MTKSQTRPLESNQILSEVSQSKIRVGLHTLFVVLTFAAYKVDPEISFSSVVVVSTASFLAAFGLHYWARRLQLTNAPMQARILQRATSIISDNLFVTLVLGIGGQSTAGLWTIYLWTSIGYGVRYGISYLYANVAVSVLAFALMVFLTPFWNQRPPFVLGMLLGMVLVPVYTGFLIKQLHRAVNERETAYKAKSEFLARMSHELRTPLHAIISTAELLKGKAQSSLQNDYVDTIALSSATLLDLINRVLDLSKFESGRIGLAVDRINIHQLLADAVNVIYHQARTKGLAVHLYSDPSISLDLVGSAAHLREIFLNIVGNAVKFTDGGFVSVSAFLDSETPRTAKIKFEVTDSGCGISERDLSRIFEPFMQSDQSITRQHGGTGLGTSFSREILRLMGGEITISSVLGLGTTVKFEIPFDRYIADEIETTTYGIRIAVIGTRSTQRFLAERMANFGPTLIGFEAPYDVTQGLLSSQRDTRIDGIVVDADCWGHNLPSIPKLIADLSLPRIVPIIGFGDPALRTVAIASGYCSYISHSPTNSQIASVLATIEAFTRKGPIGSKPEAARRKSKSLHVLVADDNATNRKVAQIALEDAGHRCTLVTNGDDALFSLNDVEFDVALLDMHMPGRDGIEVAKIYRFAGFANERPIPIILLTADSTNEAREEAESAGISKFLTKPILPSEVVRVVEDIANRYAEEVNVSSIEEASRRTHPTLPNQFPASQMSLAAEEEVPILNERAVAELVALMSKEEQTTFFAEFCEDAENYVNMVESIRTTSDVAPAREAMHALAGAALILGASRLAHIARKIERAEKGTVLMKRAEYLTELQLICGETLLEIRRHFVSTPKFD